jgi:DNA-binding MarR family transcriptional regulator
MAKKTTAAKADSFHAIRRAITRYIDATRRLFVTIDRNDYSFMALPFPGFDSSRWGGLVDVGKREHGEALIAVDRAVDGLRDELSKASSDTLPAEWHHRVDGAARIAREALESARSEGWFDGKWPPGAWHGKRPTKMIRFSAGLATSVAESIEELMLPPTERKILQALLEDSPRKADELAYAATRLKSTNASFRDTLSRMVKEGLLVSGRGQSSLGYSLTDRGIRLASNVLTIEGFLK